MIKWIISIICLLPAICYIILVNIPALLLLFIGGIPSFLFKDNYAMNMLLGEDQLYNTPFGGNPDMTISSRLGLYYKNSFLAKLVNILAFDKNHCKNAIEEDEEQGIIK
jgi:hypothetical protein